MFSSFHARAGRGLTLALTFTLGLAACVPAPSRPPAKPQPQPAAPAPTISAPGVTAKPLGQARLEERPLTTAPAPAAPVYPPASMPDTARPAPSGTGAALPPAPLPTAQSARSPAVLALLRRADEQAASGDLATSTASIERALRIEPDNALLWNRLAEWRLKQGDAYQAEQTALKSLRYAGKDKALKRRNWLIIAKAREAMGNTLGAQEARRQAGQ
ncbi:MAG: hypothetical protein PHI49_09065 [Halothiobacillaceae bacterium]|jgi:Tfp pilus assembly protein PilF|nr:hypothetical protein [Halothiobacillaceae bacterium]